VSTGCRVPLGLGAPNDPGKGRPRFGSRHPSGCPLLPLITREIRPGGRGRGRVPPCGVPSPHPGVECARGPVRDDCARAYGWTVDDPSSPPDAGSESRGSACAGASKRHAGDDLAPSPSFRSPSFPNHPRRGTDITPHDGADKTDTPMVARNASLSGSPAAPSPHRAFLGSVPLQDEPSPVSEAAEEKDWAIPFNDERDCCRH
jgi:hypothetical protein